MNSLFRQFHAGFSLKDHRQHRRIKTVLFAFALICTGVFLFFKCQFGFGNIDESFYLVTPLRLIQGDSLFSHEWHMSQMSSVLLYPIVSLFFQLNGSNESIILFMRYACTSLQLLTSVFLYAKFRKQHWLGALLASISFALYTPFGIMALSYNSLGIITLITALTLLFFSQRKTCYFLSGIAFSAAVLCCPYLSIPYFLCFFATVLYIYLAPSVSRSPSHIYRLQYFTMGICASALLFLIFVLTRTSIEKIIQALPFIFGDPEHPSISLFAKTRIFFHSILHVHPSSKRIHGILLLLFLICILDKKRKQHTAFYLSSAIFGSINLLYYLSEVRPYINYVMYPINLLTPFIVLLSSQNSIRKIFFRMYIPGIVYAFCLNLSSNQEFYAISSASSVSSVASILTLCLFASEWYSSHPKRPIRVLITSFLTVLLVMQFSAQIKLRYHSVFWENGIESQTQHIEEGIYKGLLVSEEKEQLYLHAKEDLDMLDHYAQPGDNVLYLSPNTWYYLMKDLSVSSYSAWLSGINPYTIDRLEAYYSMNPEKKPAVVYADHAYQETALLFSERFDYSVIETAYGFILISPSIPSISTPVSH